MSEADCMSGCPCHVQVRDKWIPSDSTPWLAVISSIVTHLKRGKRVVVHCNGGKGRTGTVVAAVLLSEAVGKGMWCVGINADTSMHEVANSKVSMAQAIHLMRRARPGTLKNPLQQLYLWHMKHRLHRIDVEHEAQTAQMVI